MFFALSSCAAQFCTNTDHPSGDVNVELQIIVSGQNVGHQMAPCNVKEISDLSKLGEYALANLHNKGIKLLIEILHLTYFDKNKVKDLLTTQYCLHICVFTHDVIMFEGLVKIPRVISRKEMVTLFVDTAWPSDSTGVFTSCPLVAVDFLPCCPLFTKVQPGLFFLGKLSVNDGNTVMHEIL